MDLMDRINALTDDQLQLIAARNDASGVLAEYRLAELRGLPSPERTAAVMCDGYMILAQDGAVTKVPTEGMYKIISHGSEGYCVYSEDGDQKFGCYPTLAQAQDRLAQIHTFRAEGIREGSFVEWNSSGGTARGRVEYVMTEGTLGVPESSFSIDATPDNPAVLIRIWREGADGWAETETLVGHRMNTLSRIEALKAMSKETFKPPQGVQEAGQRALDWIAEGHAGGGFTDVGRARAAQLARGDNVSEDTIRRMSSYFARHEVDSQAEGWNNGENGFPSPGRVAWEAWGGDAGKTWADSIKERLDREAEKNGEAGLTPRQNMLYEAYEEVAEVFGKFDGSALSTGAHYMEDNPFASQGMNCANCVFYEGGGGCEILSIPVKPDAVCKFWIIPDKLLVNVEETASITKQRGFVQKDDSMRFTLGPLYVPDFMDAHGEWTDSDELQRGAWEWVRSGDRRIFLQHDRSVEAGEWVELMSMPQPWTVSMYDPEGNDLGQVTYPAGTMFLGVIWNDMAWPRIKRGELRGYSIGGLSDRMLADLPEGAMREGISMEDDNG